ncbi:hypothetical protein GCM10023189_05210 [Nibrella saemangeumensis]|uniref:Uncharacterized protein n=1 Tax=Nibrella saemangeumensis TaxID=1084526 RepID=A0ABP8MCE2_9BACT
MANSANLSDGAREANQVSADDADIMFGADQAETHMVKLVDGKLVSTMSSEATISDDQPRIRLGSDEERALDHSTDTDRPRNEQGTDTEPDPQGAEKKYENSAAALRAGGGIGDSRVVPNDPIAVAGITGNPAAGAEVNTGYLTDDTDENQQNDQTTQDSGATPTAGFTVQMMTPGYPNPSTPDPNTPVPPAPETPQPPTPPSPAPEIPTIPSPTTPNVPDINGGSVTNEYETNMSANRDGSKADSMADGGIYSGLDAGPRSVDTQDISSKSDPNRDPEEGMKDHGHTGPSSRPYDEDETDTHSYESAERPQETAQMMDQPREAMDESAVKAGQIKENTSPRDPSEVKSTDMLDVKYNDPEAARNDVI